MKPEILPADGFKYYACVLMYVDDILVVHHQAENALKEIDHFFKMKPGSIAKPEFYLSAKVSWIVFAKWVCFLEHEFQKIHTINCAKCERIH